MAMDAPMGALDASVVAYQQAPMGALDASVVAYQQAGDYIIEANPEHSQQVTLQLEQRLASIGV